jgi:broad specificity phosphatase PhoE
MATFYICRHGETENNKKHVLSGWVDTPLTDEGIKNALASAAKLQNIHIDKIVSSDLGRTFVTAYIISRELDYSSEIERLRDLREVNYGELGNMPYSSFPKLPPGETEYVPDGGESQSQMQARVLQALQKLDSNNPDKTILVVGHGGTIDAVQASFSGQKISELERVYSNHDFVVKFTIENGKVTSFEEI